ncbi:AraC family transcriptional regulator [Pigmentiphaga sp. NML080357]|uniref:AraC family transcriptional regulator n=1 Tax=Pigmentiphaga sp. NML080357 TaxID=2008675 RepID=UPI000B422892|nr:helix-turn-helix transcriptional regulator [Pigmentiphaga sp. NML080357]OVZ60046.1 AraC family transcriptional regulator [Pigmentiphaga sp. NML080357]
MDDFAACYTQFDPDRTASPATAVHLTAYDRRSEQPVHRHRKGQLLMALRGSVTCRVPQGVWMVPPHCAVWVPPGMPHSNTVSLHGQVCLLFVEPGAAALPQVCCTLSISPLLREMILHLATQSSDYSPGGPTARLAAVLLEQLAQMPTEQLHLPVPAHSRLRKIADALAADPSNRSTVSQWAQQVAMSERSLARLIKAETGMSFGRWRQQLHVIAALQRLSAGMPVQRVAMDLGYESVSAFITMFRKALGKPPGRYLAERNGRQEYAGMPHGMIPG